MNCNQRRALPLKVKGTGVYIPRNEVLSTVFDQRWNHACGWTQEQTGVISRRYASEGETSSVMGAKASLAALEAANIEPTEIDCIISACGVMEQAIPCLASQIQSRMGLGKSGIPAVDINATCLSFIAALDQVSLAIAMGKFQRVLIVSSEIPSSGLDPKDQHTAGLFGDGAAAVVLERAAPEEASALLSCRMETYGIGNTVCEVKAGGTRLRVADDADAYIQGSFFRMHGPRAFSLAARYFPEFYRKLKSEAGIENSALDCIIPHQPSGKALEKLVGWMGVPTEKFVTTLPTRGNQVAASIPSALHEAIASKRISRGDIFCLVGAGAGFSLGGAILCY